MVVTLDVSHSRISPYCIKAISSFYVHWYTASLMLSLVIVVFAFEQLLFNEPWLPSNNLYADFKDDKSQHKV